MIGTGLRPAVEAVNPRDPRGGGGKPQLSLFLPPVSHWSSPVGEPTQKPVARSLVRPWISLPGPTQCGEGAWSGKRKVFLTRLLKSHGVPWAHAPQEAV